MSTSGRIERHIKPLLGNERVKDLTAVDINEFIQRRNSRENCRGRQDGKRGKAGRRGWLRNRHPNCGLLGGILTFAVKHGHPDQTTRPSGVRRPAGKPRKRRLAPAEWRHLGRALSAEAEQEGETWQVIGCIRLLALTGLPAWGGYSSEMGRDRSKRRSAYTSLTPRRTSQSGRWGKAALKS